MAPDASSRRAAGRWPRLLLGPFRSLAALPRRLADRIAPVLHAPEPPDVPARRILLILAGWTAFVAVSLVGLGWYTLRTVPLHSADRAVHRAPAPRLQVDGRNDLRRLVEAQRQRLETTGWADRKRGLVAIPIARAKALVVSRGSAAFAPLADMAPDDARSRAVDAATPNGEPPLR